MKTRTGFVSNSSSSSFCIYGICEDASTLLDCYPKDKLYEKLEVSNEDEFDEWVDDNGISEIFYSIMPGGLEFHCPENYDEQVFIGRSWRTIGDDETGGQFKAKVREEIKKHFPNLKDEDFSTHEEAFYS